MKELEFERLEEIRAELRECGYVLPSCMPWHVDDVYNACDDLSMERMSCEDALLFLDELLDGNGGFTEQINEAIIDKLETT